MWFTPRLVIQTSHIESWPTNCTFGRWFGVRAFLEAWSSSHQTGGVFATASQCLRLLLVLSSSIAIPSRASSSSHPSRSSTHQLLSPTDHNQECKDSKPTWFILVAFRVLTNTSSLNVYPTQNTSSLLATTYLLCYISSRAA